MSTTTTDIRSEARKRLAPIFRPGRRVYTLTEYTRSETDHIRVFVAETGREIREITYDVARLLSSRLSDRGIPKRGGNYSKALDVLDSAYRELGRKLDQLDWQEL